MRSKLAKALQEIRRVHSAQPFDPFKIHVADGRTYVVTHPEFMAQSQNGRMIYVTTPRGSLAAIDLLLVTSVETGLKTRDGRPKGSDAA
jgi:hypothetical protein